MSKGLNYGAVSIEGSKIALVHSISSTRQKLLKGLLVCLIVCSCCESRYSRHILRSSTFDAVDCSHPKALRCPKWWY